LVRRFELSPQFSWGLRLRIFLTYRRDDSAGQTGRIADRLKREFGDDSLFMDVDGIPLGVDFHKRLNDEVARCDVLIAAIGNRWIDLTDENGERRIDNAADFVRIEISAALRRDIPLIPILFDGTKIPKAQLLPDDVKGLAFRNGLDVRHATFHSDLDRLVRELRQISPSDKANVEAPKPNASPNEQSSKRGPWRRIAGGVTILGAISVLGMIAVVAMLPPRSPVGPQPASAVTSQPSPSVTPSSPAPEKPSRVGASMMFSLGKRYESGDGEVQDYRMARQWYEKAAAAGDSNAMISLGLLYKNGQGVTQDYGKAREWYEKAAKENANAMSLLGVLYYYGGNGLAQDYGKAREWFGKAAANDDADAMYYLGVLYYDGRGVAQDRAMAREWFGRAAAKGDEAAKVWLGR
jgi:hypothetical protein